MPEQTFLNERRISPTSLAIVLALHAAAIAALALSKMEVVTIGDYGRTQIVDVPITPDPPEPVDKPMKTPKAPSGVTLPKPLVPPPLPSDVTFDQPKDMTPPQPYQLPNDTVVKDPPAQPKIVPAEPVRTAARIDPRSQLQPPYPPSEERAEVEGRVVVRLVIGADGRVKSVAKVSATNDAFYRATERHAHRHWRFKPATIDGKPVESSTTMTVHFKLND